ncbi:uncharacterized protein LOC120922124 [Rana temporaria]|uniref:uncharacterized protein LOC120922124 n=1 Tax=Rana temporaria TaxID=8407 RepID=UPI001AAD266B|nr:uncharacterized protein LOC120922124 [Rana temporaria]
MILVLRFYLWPGGSTAWAPWQHRRSLQPLLASEDWMAAWGALPLTREESPERGEDSADGGHLVWNTGIHDLPLYHSPAPPVINLSATHPEKYAEIFETYGNARVRLCVFSKTRPDFPFPSEPPILDKDSAMVPEGAYIPHSRRKAVLDPFSSTDGIAVFIDGARFLPDAATVTCVTGRIFDKNYDQIGPDISTGIDLSSDIFHPHYNYSLQINSPNVPPTSTLLLKVYNLDRFCRELTLIGWAALNLFVESGKQRAPSSDSSEVQVSLNEGGHQIRIYHTSPPTDRPFSVESLASSGRFVPCATLLIRIQKGKIQQHAEDPMVERPQYSQGVYYSDAAHPSPGEVRLYQAMVSRSLVQVREVIPPLAGSFGQDMTSDLHLSDWVQRTFNEKMKNSTPRPFQLCGVSRYRATSGLVVSVDTAQNLPWSGITVAHICFNPPAALYYGDPWMKYDHAVPVHDIDLDSSQNCPVWRDGFKTFTRRMFYKYLTLIIHLHEIQPQEVGGHSTQQAGQEVSAMEERTQEFRAGSQAWTAMRVFYKSYCNLGAFQLPLYQGAPSLVVLNALRSEDCRTKLKDLEQNHVISRVAAASAIVRIADGRRREELERFGAQDIIRTYLPEDAIDTYAPQPSGRKLSDLLAPSGQEEFPKRLAIWCRKYLRTFYQPPKETDISNSEDKGEPHLS